MIWPFKRKEVLTFADYVAAQPVPPCGDAKLHYAWHLNGVPCTTCAVNAERARKEADENRMAEKIAAAVVKKIKEAE